LVGNGFLMCTLGFLTRSVSSVVFFSSIIVSLIKASYYLILFLTQLIHFSHQSVNSCILFSVDSLDFNVMSCFVFINLLVKVSASFNSIFSHA
jgi:hypothetical protein